VNCRHCSNPLFYTFVDLGFAPPSNAYLTTSELSQQETYYPLRVKVCEKCWLVQTEDFAQAKDLFKADYAYFSSTSKTWMEQSRLYSKEIIERQALGAKSNVIEIASNDGYLLRNFVASGIPCLGIEPTASTAAAAVAQGIPVICEFFGEALAQQLINQNKNADLIIANNVYAHVPDINDFTRGLATLLKPEGIVSIEFPHLLKLIKNCLFDTIYHEHFSYLSLTAVDTIFDQAGLRIFDVSELNTHGGSLRVFGCLKTATYSTTCTVNKIRKEEIDEGLQNIETYKNFTLSVQDIKHNFLSFLLDQKRHGRVVVAYGAAAKGNTILNYAGVKPDLIPYIYDAAPAKQGKFLPGSHIPILPPEAMLDLPHIDTVIVLPWNIIDEVKAQLSLDLNPSIQLVTLIPEIKVY
jgi:hypothetical protein